MSDKEIRDLDVSEEEGEDVKGGVKGPMPPAKNPGKPAVESQALQPEVHHQLGDPEVPKGPGGYPLELICTLRSPGDQVGVERRASRAPASLFFAIDAGCRSHRSGNGLAVEFAPSLSVS